MESIHGSNDYDANPPATRRPRLQDGAPLARVEGMEAAGMGLQRAPRGPSRPLNSNARLTAIVGHSWPFFENTATRNRNGKQ